MFSATLSTGVIRDNESGDQFLINTGREVTIIKPNYDEFLTFNLDSHLWAAKISLIAIFS